MSDKHSDAVSSGGVMLPGERMDDLQLAGLQILQKEDGFRFGMDAVLLADFVRMGERERAADFGTGTGIIPLLLAGRGLTRHIDAFEIQPDMADMARRSVMLNDLQDRISVHALPVEAADQVVQPGSLDAIVCNPPYGTPGTTLLNPSGTLSIARHQGEKGLKPWLSMAYRLLRGKGRLAMIYPAPRMLEVMQLMSKARLEPKRIRMVYPYADKPANLVLIEALKDARPMLHHEPPLIVYESDGSMTQELRRIYHLMD